MSLWYPGSTPICVCVCVFVAEWGGQHMHRFVCAGVCMCPICTSVKCAHSRVHPQLAATWVNPPPPLHPSPCPPKTHRHTHTRTHTGACHRASETMTRGPFLFKDSCQRTMAPIQHCSRFAELPDEKKEEEERSLHPLSLSLSPPSPRVSPSESPHHSPSPSTVQH